MRRIIPFIALLLAMAVLATGCALNRQESESIAEIPMPEPSDAPQNMILGERMGARNTPVTLYFARGDGASFTAVTRSVHTEPGGSLLEATVNALLTPGPVGQEMYFSTSDTRLLSFEYAARLATVNLSIDARNAQSEQELMALVTAIGNTLLSLEGVDGVNVLIGGQSERFSQLPLGVQTALVPSVTASYAQLQAERDHFMNGEVSVSRTAALYFPSADGQWLVPELRTLSLSHPDFATDLIGALREGPAGRQGVASLPEGVELLETPRLITLSSGEHALVINYSSTLANYLAFSGMEVWQLLASITLTMSSFIPEVDAVRVLVNGEAITVCEIDGEIMRFAGGLIRRGDFVNRVGSPVTLYLADTDGALVPEERAVSRRAALSPRSVLETLFGCAGALEGPGLPLPAEIDARDILGIQVDGGIARINLSANFYRACQRLNPKDERSLVYAMVNTLCALADIRGVRFYVEGYSADTLAGNIYLKSTLLPNPGIVRADEAEGS